MQKLQNRFSTYNGILYWCMLFEIWVNCFEDIAVTLGFLFSRFFNLTSYNCLFFVILEKKSRNVFSAKRASLDETHF